MNNKTFYFLFFAFSFLIITSDPAFAAAAGAPTEIEKTLCRVLNLLTGNIGKAIAAFAIIMIGVSLFMGKVSWGLAISTAMGIGAIFGAAGLVQTLGGGTTLDCTTVLA